MLEAAPICVSVRMPLHVVVRSFVTETVLMDVATARYFSLDRASGAMLAALDEHGSVAEAARALVAGGWGPGGEVEGDLSELVRELEELGLLEVEIAA
jgi:hypothetical protein